MKVYNKGNHYPAALSKRCECHTCFPELLLNRPVFGVRAGVNGLPALVEEQASQPVLEEKKRSRPRFGRLAQVIVRAGR